MMIKASNSHADRIRRRFFALPFVAFVILVFITPTLYLSGAALRWSSKRLVSASQAVSPRDGLAVPESIQEYIRADQLNIQRDGDGTLRAWSTVKGLFYSDRATFHPRDGSDIWRVAFSLKTLNGTQLPVDAPQAEKNLVVYRHGAYITELYENRTDGIEQKFLIESLPPTDYGLQLVGVFETGLTPTRVPGRGIVFKDRNGVEQFLYGEATLIDAHGKTIPARMSLRGAHAPERSSVRGSLRDEAISSEIATVPRPRDLAMTYVVTLSFSTQGLAFPLTIDPLITTPANTIDPTNEVDAQFGYAVSTAGDVNGDLFSDIIVGAPFFDGTNGDEGRAYVFHGSSSGLSSTAAITLTPGTTTQDTISFGNAVSTAGDVNGDGYSDVIVGAELWGDGVEGTNNEGRAYVFHGSASGLSSTPARTLDPTDQANARFGNAVSTAGDVNGDGYSDVVIGAFQWDGTVVDEGGVYVYHGSASGLPATQTLILESTDQGSARFGFSVALAGDVNGDSYSDVIVSASNFDSQAADEGRAYIFTGSSSGLAASAVTTVDPADQVSAIFGNTVASAGDVNGDGYADVIISAPLYDGGAVNEGRAYIYHGSSSGIATDATPATTFEPTDQADSDFGVSAATAGDVNGDGYSDVIIGAHIFNGAEATDEGRVYVYFGVSGGIANQTTSSCTVCPTTLDPTDQTNARFGTAVFTAGDVDGDGYSDIVVGAPLFDGTSPTAADEGRVYLFRGSADGLATSAGLTLDPTDQANAQFAYTAYTAGDVNGDGYADVIATAPLFDGEATDEGRAYVFHGSSTGLSSTAAWTVDPTNQASARFGHYGETAGDVNGDGYSDVIVSANNFDGEATDEGRVYIYHGSSSGLSTTAAITLDPTDQASANFGGNQATTAGDVNGDGYSDVIIGAQNFDAEASNEGRVYIYHGSSSGVSSAPARTLDPTDQTNARFGFAASYAGDVNGDGYSDVMISAANFDAEASNEGRVYIYHGSSSGIPASPALTLDPTDQIDAQLGNWISHVGDVNGDGYADIALGASGFDNQAASEGRVYIYHGSSSGLSTTAALTLDPTDQANANFGVQVHTAGDVNGDGYSDVYIGATGFDGEAADEGRGYVYMGSSSGVSSSPSWTVDPTDQAGASFGFGGAAGDVNGDGYSDVIIGAQNFDAQATNEGRAYVFYGGGGVGLALNPAQLPANTKDPLIQPLGASTNNGMTGRIFARIPSGGAGLARAGSSVPTATIGNAVRVEVEAKSETSAFDGTGTALSSLIAVARAGTTINTGTAPLNALNAGGTPYHWRIRLRYNQTPPLYLGGTVSRWIYFGSNGAREMDFRTANAAPTISNLEQLTAAGASIGVGGQTAADDIVLRATVTDDDPASSAVRVQTELKRITSTLDGTGLETASAMGSSGAASSVTYNNQTAGRYHWRARSQDRWGLTSSLTSFGGNADGTTDFQIAAGAPSAPPTVSPSQPTSPAEPTAAPATPEGEPAPPTSEEPAPPAEEELPPPPPPAPVLTLSKSVGAIVAAGAGVTMASTAATGVLGILAALFLLNLALLQAHHDGLAPGRRLFALLPAVLTSPKNAYMFLRACGPEGCQGAHFARYRTLHNLSRVSLAGTVALGIIKLFFVVVFASVIPASDVRSQTMVAPPGSTVTFALNFGNTGEARATSVVIRDPIPAGTEYVGGSLNLNGAAYPAMLEGGVLRLELAELGVNNSGVAQFAVRVLGSAPSTIENQATIGANEVSPPVASNTVGVATVAPPAEEPAPETAPEPVAQEPTPPVVPPSSPPAAPPSAVEAPVPPAPTAPTASGGGGVVPSEIAPPSSEIVPPSAVVPEAEVTPTTPAGGGTVSVFPEVDLGTPLEEARPAPPTVTEQAVVFVLDAIEKRAPVVGKALKTVNRATVDNPRVEEVNQTLVVPVIIATGATSAGVVASSASFLPYLQYLFTQPLLLFTRRRRKQWGTVYNAVSKIPVDLAVVRLNDAATGNLVQTKVTDKHGRFFFLPSPGAYRVSVIKQNFAFPSATLQGKPEDVGFAGLYFGGDVVVKEGEVVAPNIPVDPTVPEEAPAKVVFKTRVHQAQHLLSGASIAAGVAAFLITPRLLTLGFLALHTVLYRGFRAFAYPARPKGLKAVLDAERRKPLAGAIARIFDTAYNKLLETQVTDRAGRYGFLVGRNAYYVTVEKDGYTKAQTLPVDLMTVTEPQVVSVEVEMKRA